MAMRDSKYSREDVHGLLKQFSHRNIIDIRCPDGQSIVFVADIPRRKLSDLPFSEGHYSVEANFGGNMWVHDRTGSGIEEVYSSR
jgi:hypothetical protein